VKFSHYHLVFPFLFDGDDQIDQPILSHSRNSGLSGLQGIETVIAAYSYVKSGQNVARHRTKRGGPAQPERCRESPVTERAILSLWVAQSMDDRRQYLQESSSPYISMVASCVLSEGGSWKPMKCSDSPRSIAFGDQVPEFQTGESLASCRALLRITMKNPIFARLAHLNGVTEQNRVLYNHNSAGSLETLSTEAQDPAPGGSWREYNLCSRNAKFVW
jgi:hypothetical protein